ncbi:MAG: PstS family phosphate ABC transporter substrate-binding protein [Phycisphaerae bacterium]
MTAIHTFRSFAAAALAVTAFASFGSSDALGQTGGRVDIDGSSTVYPITAAAAEEFSKENPDVRTTVGISGTGGGMKRFAAGETDISNASRPIKYSEAQTAQENGVEFIELPIAYDGLSIVVNPKNEFVQQLTVDELKLIFRADNPAKTWQEVNSAYPAEEIKIFMPGTASGTFDYFREVVIGNGSARGDAAVSVSEDDNVLVRGVAGNEFGIGFFGSAYYFENKDQLRSVAIVNPAGDAVRPTVETIESGEYAPFSRPLFIYVNKASANKPEVEKFVGFYMENAGRLANEVGYVGLPRDIYRQATRNFRTGKTGTVFSTEDGKSKEGSLREIYMQ